MKKSKFIAMAFLTAAAFNLVATPGVAGAFQRQPGKIKEKIFSRLDADGDGKIAETEFTARRAEQFGKMDRDGDGSVTLSEMKEAAEGRSRRFRKRRGDRGGNVEARLNRADRNGDGVVSKSEFEENGRELFKKIDPDGSGQVTLEEFMALGMGALGI